MREKATGPPKNTADPRWTNKIKAYFAAAYRLATLSQFTTFQKAAT